MKVLLFGARGFIGRHTAVALRAAGHEVIAGKVDFTRALQPADWLASLEGVDAVVNAVGIIRERWVEFVQGGKVVGREVASIIPADEVKDTQPGPDLQGSAPRAGTRVELLKGGDYLRVWITRGGVQYLIHMPPA